MKKKKAHRVLRHTFPNFLKYISSTIVLFISFNHIINISSQSIFYSLTG